MSTAPEAITFQATEIRWDIIRPHPMEHAEPFIIARNRCEGPRRIIGRLRFRELHADGPRGKFIAVIASAEKIDDPDFRDSLTALLFAAFGPLAMDLEIAEAAKRLESSPKK